MSVYTPETYLKPTAGAGICTENFAEQRGEDGYLRMRGEPRTYILYQAAEEILAQLEIAAGGLAEHPKYVLWAIKQACAFAADTYGYESHPEWLSRHYVILYRTELKGDGWYIQHMRACSRGVLWRRGTPGDRCFEPERLIFYYAEDRDTKHNKCPDPASAIAMITQILKEAGSSPVKP